LREDYYFGERIAKSKIRKRLKSLYPEIIIDITGTMMSASLIFSSRARKIIGMNRNQFKAIYDSFITSRTIPHLTNMYLDVVNMVVTFKVEENTNYFENKITIDGKILVQPKAGWDAKEWNLNKFIKLAEKLNMLQETCFIIPANSIPSDIVYELSKKEIDVIQTNSLEGLIEHIKHCFVFIGNDSGPLYIASLLGKPTFTIYGPTNYEYSLPFGNNHEFISKKLKCSPKENEQYCFTTAGIDGCPSFECMNLLEMDEVYNSISNFINDKLISIKN
jgi:heptosyltransferase-2